MRRISLALALAGAVTATGCGSSASSQSGGAKGVGEGTFTVNVQNGQAMNGGAANPTLAIKGGYVTSVPAGIDCGIAPHAACSFAFPVGTGVVLTAFAVGSDTSVPPKAYLFLGWAGDCTGDGTCTLDGNADKYLLAMFSGERTSHANFTAPLDHVSAYLVQSQAGALKCTQCHGASLQGTSIAVACNSCHTLGGHEWPVPAADVTNVAVLPSVGKHFQASGHNSAGCGRCHAGSGFRDYIGADGTADNHLGGYLAGTPAKAGVLDGTTFTAGMACDMCHNAATVLGGGALNTIQFPQATGTGKTVTVDGVTAICGQCHTGARDDYNVAQLALKIGATTDDAQIPTGNSVVRAHFLPAAATLLGSDAGNWYQYPSKVYTARNQHGGKASCTSCHDAHNGSLPADADIAAKCGACHFNEAGAPVQTFLELEEVRQFGFEGDVDGDAIVESLKAEIDGVAAVMYAAIQAYATNVAGAGICAIDNRYYIQVNTTDACGAGANNVAYNKFTPRLLRAGYNYLIWQNDVGAWAHNPRYTIEVLFDAIADLNAGLGANAVPFAGLRTFGGHFGGSQRLASGGMTFADWDPGPVPNNCSQCHAGQDGIEHYLADQNTALTTPSVTGMQCTTCHAPAPADARFTTMRTVATLNFPPRKAATKQVSFDAATLFPKAGDRVCATCHSGRENKVSIDDKIAAQAVPTGDASWNISFTNPHYLGAAGMMLGFDATMLYQYSGKTYTAKPIFWGAPYGSPHGQSCAGCHNPQGSKHSFEIDLATTVPGGLYHGVPNTQSCKACHDAHLPNGLETVRTEYEERSAELYARIQTYATAAGNPICYNGAAYPYWFKDNGYVDATTIDPLIAGNGVCDATESVSANSTKFNPKGSKAAFNYKWTQAEPGAWAHNEAYVFQIIFDSIEDLGGTPSFTRPVAPAGNVTP